MAKKLISDKLVPVYKGGKTLWITQDQYDELIAGIVDFECLAAGQCEHSVREKTFHVPEFVRGKILLSEQHV